ncbi:MAG: hypothetical protein ACE5NM_11765 [Sedimentisphaerales bacterium]
MVKMQNPKDNHRFVVNQYLQWHPAPIEPRTLFHLTLWLELCLQDNWCGAGFSSIGPET